MVSNILRCNTNKPAITKEYCETHTPETFIGNVNHQLASGAKTDKGIMLDKFTFNVIKKKWIYFLNGTLRARGKSKGKLWEDHLSYYCYKLSEYDVTRGVWSSGECKGYFRGKMIK